MVSDVIEIKLIEIFTEWFNSIMGINVTVVADAFGFDNDIIIELDSVYVTLQSISLGKRGVKFFNDVWGMRILIATADRGQANNIAYQLRINGNFLGYQDINLWIWGITYKQADAVVWNSDLNCYELYIEWDVMWREPLESYVKDNDGYYKPITQVGINMTNN
jgi:hypothetical protein